MSEQKDRHFIVLLSEVSEFTGVLRQIAIDKQVWAQECSFTVRKGPPERIKMYFDQAVKALGKVLREHVEPEAVKAEEEARRTERDRLMKEGS